ncbi:MAG: CoA transferase [Pseudomonadota bacterium]
MTVLELGVWIAGPACAAMLADWGARVIKLEPPGGEPARHSARALGLDIERNPAFELDNRGKLGLSAELRSDEGQQQLHRLLPDVDVLITNMRPAALARLRLDPATIRERYPRLVYGQVTGYGSAGPDKDRAGYDTGGFWARSGVALRVTPQGEPPAAIPSAFGDHITAMALASGILAALLQRERTGRGELVETSLLRTGIYSIATDYAMYLGLGRLGRRKPRSEADAPLVNAYRCRDGLWLWLLAVESDRHWPALVTALSEGADASALGADEFADARSRRKHRAALIAALDNCFAALDRDDWIRLLDEQGVWWAPVQTVQQAVEDVQVEASGAFVDIPAGANGPALRSIATPVSFGGVTPMVTGPSPALGEHNDELLPPE